MTAVLTDKEQQPREAARGGFPVYGWIIIGLFFAATTVNYFDRLVLPILIKDIREDLGFGNVAYGYVNAARSFMYMAGFLVAGRVIDRLGTKKGYLLSITSWSATAAMTSLSGSAWSLGFWSGLLGLTQSGNFPAAIKGVSEWFSPKQRAFATSLFNSGASVAPIVAPFLIAFVAKVAGWRWAFVTFGLLGLILVAAWPFLYKNPPQHGVVARKELTWRKLLEHRDTYGIMIGKFLTDPVWWFYMFWMPPYLYDKHGFSVDQVAWAFAVIYLIAIVLGNLIGWLPGFLAGRGWSILKSRKTVMLGSALLMPFVMLAIVFQHPWVAIMLVALACAAHNGWSANIFTLTSDCFPPKAVASVTGLAGFGGALGGILFSSLVPGYAIEWVGYQPVFVLMGLLHPVAYVIIRFTIRDSGAEVSDWEHA
jgi:ACS family hexuronate transporter-like MFS transporter